MYVHSFCSLFLGDFVFMIGSRGMSDTGMPPCFFKCFTSNWVSIFNVPFISMICSRSKVITPRFLDGSILHFFSVFADEIPLAMAAMDSADETDDIPTPGPSCKPRVQRGPATVVMISSKYEM